MRMADTAPVHISPEGRDRYRMKATDLLKQQHEEVKDLYARYGQTDDDDEKQALFEELADNLAAHAIIEERIFYPAAFAGEDLQEKLREAVEEHLAVKRVLSDLLAMLPDEESFDAKLKVLIEMVDHHVEEEEREILPKAEKLLGAATLERLGNEMETLFEDVMNEGPSDILPLEIDQPAPLTR
jgi:hypothetical protein